MAARLCDTSRGRLDSSSSSTVATATSGIAHVVDDGADVLVRVNRGALPLYDDAAT